VGPGYVVLGRFVERALWTRPSGRSPFGGPDPRCRRRSNDHRHPHCPWPCPRGSSPGKRPPLPGQPAGRQSALCTLAPFFAVALVSGHPPRSREHRGLFGRAAEPSPREVPPHGRAHRAVRERVAEATVGKKKKEKSRDASRLITDRLPSGVILSARGVRAVSRPIAIRVDRVKTNATELPRCFSCKPRRVHRRRSTQRKVGAPPRGVVVAAAAAAVRRGRKRCPDGGLPSLRKSISLVGPYEQPRQLGCATLDDGTFQRDR